MQLYRGGMTDKEIAALFDVTPQAVNKRFKLIGVRRAPYKVIVTEILESIWPADDYNRPAFSHLSRAKSLYVYLRKRLGDDSLSPRQVKEAILFERGIRERNVVLHLDPLWDQPWQYVAREECDGLLVVRWPPDSERLTGPYLEALCLPDEPWS